MDNPTIFDYESEGLIHEMFIRQARKTPDNMAVVSPGEGKHMTYKELDMATDILATSLTSLGVKENCIVGILMEKNLDFIVTFIATLKAGNLIIHRN